MVYSGARGKLVHERNLKSKILSRTPFNSMRFGNYVVKANGPRGEP
jgi:hypothetical protein